ncbi:MAG: hypothetical protein AB1489_43675, partial [Acidobacteriota bacterium]
MITLSSRRQTDRYCRARYLFLARECHRQGLNTDEIFRSANQLSYLINGNWYLKDVAYQPTGIALGCPVPDKRIKEKLWRLSKLIANYIGQASDRQQPTFAFVPPDYYHITVLNRSHFDCSSDYRESLFLSETEKRISEDVIAQVCRVPLVFHINGLIITSAGRLIVPGFPNDDRIYKLRANLVKALP